MTTDKMLTPNENGDTPETNPNGLITTPNGLSVEARGKPENLNESGKKETMGKSEVLPVVKKTHATLRKSVDINTLLDYAKKGLTVTQLANITQTTTENIVQRLKPYREDLQAVTDYEKTKGFLLTNVERKLLGKVNELATDCDSLSQASVSFGILYDKGRLERGQSTQNVSMLARLSDQLEREEWTADSAPAPLTEE